VRALDFICHEYYLSPTGLTEIFLDKYFYTHIV
jgi:hypothetical protein